jgi:hypothetical protein
MRTYVAVGLAIVSLALGGSTAVAQDSVLAELYGYGVHAYNAGEYQESHEYLTTAIEQGSLDPRVYYFRGLAYTRLGRPEDAKLDYQKGANLEASGADRVYPVGRSLQRVQGRSRLEVERYRQQARLALRVRNRKATQARYEQLKNAEGQVLRDPNRPQPANAEELVGPPAASDASDPFGAEAAAEAPAPAPAVAAPPSEPAGGDLFGETPAAPAAPAPMPADAGDDPFGAPGTPGTPAAPAAPAADDDPFGAPGAPAGDEGDDPFADDAPGAMPADGDDDPFGP